MRGGQHYSTQAHRALTEIGVAATPAGHGADFGLVRLDEVYRPAKTLTWHTERGWTLTFEGREWGDWIVIGPPEMTPGKAARAVATLLTAQAQQQTDAVKNAIYSALGEKLEDRLGWETVRDLRNQILSAMDADVLAGQNGGGRG